MRMRLQGHCWSKAGSRFFVLQNRTKRPYKLIDEIVSRRSTYVLCSVGWAVEHNRTTRVAHIEWQLVLIGMAKGRVHYGDQTPPSHCL